MSRTAPPSPGSQPNITTNTSDLCLHPNGRDIAGDVPGILIRRSYCHGHTLGKPGPVFEMVRDPCPGPAIWHVPARDETCRLEEMGVAVESLTSFKR
jgi:hypothetical protein